MKSVVRKLVGKSVISATILCFAIGTGAAFAQTPAALAAPITAAAPAAPPAAPSASTAAPAMKTAKPRLSSDDKKKLSQECSAQANDKKLHGKDRRTFRATCIRHGGTA